MIKKILKFFDRLEDRTRKHLSSYPLIYATVAGIAVVLFWRGVWHTADLFNLSGPASFLIGLFVLLLIGALVSSFIGNSIIISGLRGEKKIEEKTLEEIKTEEEKLDKISKQIEAIEKQLEERN